jgi:hypothetical protein
VVDCEPLIVLMPSDHRLASREAIHPREFVGEIFIGGSEKATVPGAVTQDYLPTPLRAQHPAGPRGGQHRDGHLPGCVMRSV